MNWTIRFQQPSSLPSNTLAIIWLFPFTVVDSSLIGAPEENYRTSPHQIRVTASIQLVHAWGFIFSTSIEDNEQTERDRYNLMKVMFEYGQRYIIRKLGDTGKLETEEKLALTITNTEAPCPFDPSRIQNPVDVTYEVKSEVRVNPSPDRVTKTDETISILFLAADPTDKSRLRLGEESREIQEKLQLAKQRDKFKLEQRMSVRSADISQVLLDIQPQIVHFSGHGKATGDI